MNDVVSLTDLRAQLNALLAELPAAARKVAQDGLESVLRASDPQPTEGSERGLHKNVGRGYTALRDEDCDVLRELTEAGVKLLAKGPDFEVVGDLLVLLFTIRRHGVRLTTDEGLVLRVLRQATQPLKVHQIGDLLAAQRAGMTDNEVDEALRGLCSRLNQPGRTPTIVSETNGWRSDGV